jgi:hypothetical protein
MPEVRGSDCGDWGGSMSPAICDGVLRPGEEDRDPALKGWKDTDGLLAILMPSNEISDALDVCIGLDLGIEPMGGEFASEPMVLAARRAEMGLEPLGGASPWNVDRLP